VLSYYYSDRAPPDAGIGPPTATRRDGQGEREDQAASGAAAVVVGHKVQGAGGVVVSRNAVMTRATCRRAGVVSVAASHDASRGGDWRLFSRAAATDRSPLIRPKSPRSGRKSAEAAEVL